MSTAYLKMGIYGEAGSGKTYTASQIAKGLALFLEKKFGERPPVMMVDTENGSHFVAPIFQKAGIEFLVAQTRAYADLKVALREAQAAGAILFVDSVTHFWEEMREAYLEAKRKRLKNRDARLELPDWNAIKPEWAKFTSLFLNAHAHIILCGRAASVYEFQDREDGSRKDMITVGTKMAAEKGLGYEPNLLIEMSSEQLREAGKKKVVRRKATVLKDRATLLDGQEFINPKFENFLPHINSLNLGGKHQGFDQTRSSVSLFPQDEKDNTARQRRIVIDEIQTLLVLHIPGQAAADKQRRAALIKKYFNASWTEIEEVMPLLVLRGGYDGLHRELEGMPSRYASNPVADIAAPDDEIPLLNGSGTQEAEPVHASA
ncbi:MAG: AAA family ATPase [Rhodomicrobium sp.]